MNTADALRQALKDMRDMTPQQLREELDKHKGGHLAQTIGEANMFLKQLVKDKKPDA